MNKANSCISRDYYVRSILFALLFVALILFAIAYERRNEMKNECVALCFVLCVQNLLCVQFTFMVAINL